MISEETTARLLAEGVRPVSELADLVPAERGKRCPGTIVNWIKYGKDGVKLEGFQGAGKGWYSSVGALARFFSRLTGGRAGSEAPPPEQPSNRPVRSERAKAKLKTIRGQKV